MLSFKTRSYIEQIWNALWSVETKTRKWDMFNLDETIIRMVADSVPTILKDVSRENVWYAEVEELGQVAERLTKREYERIMEEIKDEDRFAELLKNNLYHLWF